ncbi:MAG: hypothetical protein V4812_10300 [Pseudomonadota bacterium]
MQDKVIHLHRRDPQGALTRLNRITGLRFSRWPESLVQVRDESACEPLPTVPFTSSVA